jgi:P pilus assembly chaperone PapD
LRTVTVFTPPKPSGDSWKPKLSADSRAQPLSVRNASPVAVTVVATACAASTRPTPPSVRL